MLNQHRTLCQPTLVLTMLKLTTRSTKKTTVQCRCSRAQKVRRNPNPNPQYIGTRLSFSTLYFGEDTTRFFYVLPLVLYYFGEDIARFFYVLSLVVTYAMPLPCRFPHLRPPPRSYVRDDAYPRLSPLPRTYHVRMLIREALPPPHPHHQCQPSCRPATAMSTATATAMAMATALRLRLRLRLRLLRPSIGSWM